MNYVVADGRKYDLEFSLKRTQMVLKKNMIQSFSLSELMCCCLVGCITSHKLKVRRIINACGQSSSAAVCTRLQRQYMNK